MAESKKSLSDALRSYWWALIGIAVFPSGFFFISAPFAYFIPPFFAVWALASWPYFSGKAPYSFNWVAGGIWLAGAAVGLFVASFVRAILA